MQMFAHGAVKTSQEHLTAIQQRGLGAQPLENPRELDGNVASAHNQHALWQRLEKERFVRTDGVFMPRDLGDLRPATGGDEDVFCRVPLTIDQHLVWPGQGGVPLQQRNTTVNQQVAVDTIETIDFTVFVGNQRGPVEAGSTQRPAKA